MPLDPGSRLGPYEILSPLGAGGMGEVYRARDTRLSRDVALKVLPTDFASDPSRRQRFEQEARAVAALNHPNIVAIYDVGDNYIVTELVEGEALRGAKLSLRKTFDIAVQIAGGLAAAHAAGITHRDLKPDNILLTRDARVKILDFGLAKIRAAQAAVAEGTQTMTVRTEPGIVMGTVGYMSPEQVRGLDVDHRSDIFSFGVILHEILSGKRAFHGETSVDTMQAILRQDPPDLPDTVPAPLRQIVAHCLEKDAANRFQSACDLGFALSAIAQSSTHPGSTPVPAIATPARRRALLLLAAAGALAATAILTHYFWKTPPPPSWTGTLLGGPDVALTPRLSPDGRTLGFLQMVDGLTQVAVMKPEAGNWSLLTHTRGRGSITTISWSPDGNRIFYDRMADLPRGVYSVPVLGGEEQLVIEDAGYPEVLPDGSLIVAKMNAAHECQIFRIWPETGRQQPLPLHIDLGAYTPLVRAQPGGRSVIVQGDLTGHPQESGRRLYQLDLVTGATRLLTTARATYTLRSFAVTRDGRSVLFSDLSHGTVSLPLNGSAALRTLFPGPAYTNGMDTASDGSIVLDQADRTVTLQRFPASGGHAVQLAQYPIQDALSQFASLGDGRFVWLQQAAGRDRLVIASPGKEQAQISGTEEDTLFPVTVAGPKQIAFAIGRERKTIGIASIETRRIIRRFPFDKGVIDSMWSSPDGNTLYCSAAGAIWAQPSSGAPATRLRAGSASAIDPAGQFLIVTEVIADRGRFTRFPLDGSPEHPIELVGDARPVPIVAGSIGKDGRLLIGLQYLDSWFLDPSIVDLTTGQVTRIPVDFRGDTFTMFWAPDGQVLAAMCGLRSSLWKFTPQ